MSAPQTDPEKQARRHRGPLVGMALVAVFGVLLIIYWLFEVTAGPDEDTSRPPELPAGAGDVDQGVPADATEGLPPVEDAPD